MLITLIKGYTQPGTGYATSLNDTLPGYEITYDTIHWPYRVSCKGLAINWLLLPHAINTVIPAINITKEPVVLPIKKTPLLTIHGNVQYNFLYRSFVDTPFSQNNFQQHTIQTFLNITVKDKYPFKVNVSQRISNSPFFRNFLDLNTQFDRYAYLKSARQQLLDRLSVKQFKRPDLTKAEKALKELMDKYNALKKMLSGGDVLQKLVEERERQYLKQQRAKDSSSNNRALPTLPGQLPDLATLKQRWYRPVKRPSAANLSMPQPEDSSYSAYIEKKKKELDSLEQKVGKLQAKTDSLKNAVNKNLIGLQQKIYRATSLQELKKIGADNELPAEKSNGMDKFLANVKSIGIGRSVINYSELTAWNVSVTGFNMEYTPGIYTAIAAGKIDYGFRDFLGKNSRQKGQNFFIGRLGLGDPESKALIFSAFAGKKYSYGALITDTLSNYVNIVGYSMEAVYKKGQNTSISAEIAKTTIPTSGNTRTSNGMKSLWQFSDNANLGLSIKGQTLLTKTGTRLSGFYRKTGESFQSFSLFTYNTDQTSWSLKVDQPFFKNKVGLIAMLRRNDFVNPLTEKTFKTSTVFKNIQLDVRIPRWPVVSMGYYPGTQLYIIDKERIRENAYYIVNGSILYNYKAGNVRMLSSLIYNRYSGKGTDSGFIAYSGSSYMASQAFMFRKLQLQGLYMFTDQEQMQFYSAEANGDFAFSNMLRAGAGIKYNKVSGGKSYMGSRASIGIDIKKLGGLQLQYEKSYLPTIWQTLYPVETGTLSWFKYF